MASREWAGRLSLSIKRALDVVGAVVGLAVLLPLLLGIAALVRLSLGAPVLFRQVRPGRVARPFTIWKFRTMRDFVDADDRALPDSMRLTRLGRVLREWSLDELPSLWNVLRGDMSLVGPRPLLTEYLARYSERQARRHEVRPGITGWAQVNGRNRTNWHDRLELDVWYVENRSLSLDLQILLRTVWIVLKRDGISQPGHATVEPFRG